MSVDIHPRAEAIVRECIGRLRGALLYDENEAAETIRAVLAKPVQRKNYGYGVKPTAPWKPGDPKPTKRAE